MFGKFIHSMHGHSFYNSLFQSNLKFLTNSFSVIKKTSSDCITLKMALEVSVISILTSSLRLLNYPIQHHCLKAFHTLLSLF